MAGDSIPTYIAHEDGTFKAHIQSAHNYWYKDGWDTDETLCGIRWIDLPNNRDSTTGEEWIDDKPWYYDHDRDDVVPCEVCYGQTS